MIGWRWAALLLLPPCWLGCGDDNDGTGGSEAQRRGVGAACNSDADCSEVGQHCLTEFKGGYCGVKGCQSNAECPQGSACVQQSNGNYCFLICANKPECNYYRPVDFESNCSSNVTFTDPINAKACVPPSN